MTSATRQRRRKPWSFVAPCLSLLPDAAGQRVHDLREVSNALRYVVRTGCPWRWLPNDLPPWHPELIPGTLDDLFRHPERIDAVLARSYVEVAKRHKRLGRPAAVYRDGRVILIPAEDIVVPEGPEEPPKP